MGSKGNDVTALQQILKEKGLYAFPTATGYFGPVTQQAVKLFQKTEGIVSIGTPETTGYGVVGPKTIASLNAFEGTSSLSTTSISASTTTSFTRNLEYGMQGQDVLALQEFLNANGFTIANSGPGSPGHETDYFGSATQSALIKFQQANHITPAVGYFGPITRASFTSVSQSQNQGQANTAFVCPSSLLCTPTFVSSIFSSSPCSASQVPISTNGVISCMAIRGGGSSYTTPATQMTDTTPPVISSIASTTSQTGATITWTTDKNSSSQVEYGLTSSYTASTTLDSTLTTSHSVNISGLMANTTYHFAPYSTDSSGTSYGNDQTFTTSQQIVTLNIPFYATSTITLLGTQTAIASSSMTVSCADMSGNTLSCSKSYAPDTYNSAYSNLTLTFSGQQSGIVTVSGPQTFDHYVDSINGNDSNNGASPSKAFKTIGKVTGLGMTSGETIGLANNSWWREGISLNNTSHILVGSYGTGTMPLLDESNIITGTDAYGNSSTTAWTNTTGTTWQATVYTNSGGWVNFWKNNTYVPQASSLANCESSVSSYWVSSENGGTITLYYNSGSVSNPGSDGNLYEYSARVAGIAGFGDGAMYDTVIGIRVRRSLNNNGGIDLGNYAMVLNSEADDGTKHNILVGDGSVVNNLTLHNAWYNGQGSSLFVFFADNTQGAGVTVNGLTATMDVYDQTVEGIYGHYTGGSGFGPNVAFTNVTCTNTSACVNGLWTYLANLTSNSGGGITSWVNATATNMTMINPGQAVGIGATGVTLNVNGLTANCNAINTGCIRISAMGTSLIMSSSTISNPTGFAIYVDDGNKLQELSITNTDYLCPVPNNQDCNYLMDNTVPTTTIMDYNTYHYPYPGHYGSSMRWNGNWITISGLIGWSNWQALGFDAHSTTTTP